MQEYERAVIFRLGRLLSGGARGPGVYSHFFSFGQSCKMQKILHKGITWGIFAVFRRDISSGCDWLFFIYRVQLLVIEHMYIVQGGLGYIHTLCHLQVIFQLAVIMSTPGIYLP